MADDEDRGDGGAGGGQTADTGPAMGPVYTMWENSLDKLKVLNYETNYLKKFNRKPLHRVSFVLPSANQSHQFEDFHTLCSWLINSEITKRNDSFKTEPFDDPNTIVNKLLVALRQLDFRSTFPPQKLRTPFGESTVTVLDFLTEKALQQKGFQWAAPVYNELDDGVGQEDQGNDRDNGNEDDAILEDEGIEGANGAGDHNNEEINSSFYEEPGANGSNHLRLDSSTDANGLTSTHHNIIHAAIDPIEWKTELERVAGKLKNYSNPNNSNNNITTSYNNEWRSHVDQTLLSKNAIEKVIGNNQQEYLVINKNIGEELNSMKMKEKYLNNQYNNLSLEFVEIKHKLEELEKKSTASNEIVSKKTNELAEISEKLEDLKESFENKDSGLNDTSPLVKFKSALQQLKEEIHHFDMRTGVVSHTLLSARVSEYNLQRVKAAKKAKQRHQRRGGSGNKGGGRRSEGKEMMGLHDDNSGLSGED